MNYSMVVEPMAQHFSSGVCRVLPFKSRLKSGNDIVLGVSVPPATNIRSRDGWGFSVKRRSCPTERAVSGLPTNRG